MSDERMGHQDDLYDITAKEWLLKNWNNYEMPSIKTRDEFLGLLNILQSWNESIETMHKCITNCHDEFTHIWNHGGWETMDDLYRAIMSYNMFYTDDEFVEWIQEKMVDLKEEEYENPVAEIKEWTYADDFSYDKRPTDTMIKKTDDGYVIQITY